VPNEAPISNTAGAWMSGGGPYSRCQSLARAETGPPQLNDERGADFIHGPAGVMVRRAPGSRCQSLARAENRPPQLIVERRADLIHSRAADPAALRAFGAFGASRRRLDLAQEGRSGGGTVDPPFWAPTTASVRQPISASASRDQSICPQQASASFDDARARRRSVPCPARKYVTGAAD
jgi:hypothetical protein